MPRRRTARRTSRRAAPHVGRKATARSVGRNRRRTLSRTSRLSKLITRLAVLLALLLFINWIYQVVRKPSELLFPVSGALYKTPAETWRQYGPLFREHATKIITPELLAALAQVEGSGNPVVRTYWRWSWSSQPFEVYRPASSAVGMYQITDGTFAQARHYCIRHHVVVEDGPWNRWQSCWFNSLYARVIPTDAVELTAAYLDRNVALTLERHGMSAAAPQRQQDLATVIHLCGAGAGDLYARRGFRLSDDQRCGDHTVSVYLGRVTAMKAQFERMARESGAPP